VNQKTMDEIRRTCPDMPEHVKLLLLEAMRDCYRMGLEEAADMAHAAAQGHRKFGWRPQFLVLEEFSSVLRQKAAMAP